MSYLLTSPFCDGTSSLVPFLLCCCCCCCVLTVNLSSLQWSSQAICSQPFTVSFIIATSQLPSPVPVYWLVLTVTNGILRSRPSHGHQYPLFVLFDAAATLRLLSKNDPFPRPSRFRSIPPTLNELIPGNQWLSVYPLVGEEKVWFTANLCLLVPVGVGRVNGNNADTKHAASGSGSGTGKRVQVQIFDRQRETPSDLIGLVIMNCEWGIGDLIWSSRRLGQWP